MFTSHMLNRDTWSDDVVQNLVASGFVFWQVHRAASFVSNLTADFWSLRICDTAAAQNYWASEHGKKFCSLYQIDRDSLPIVVIIDPRTGEIRQRWTGFLEPQDMTEKCTTVIEGEPTDSSLFSIDFVYVFLAAVSDFCCMHTLDAPSTELKKVWIALIMYRLINGELNHFFAGFAAAGG